MRPTIHLRRGLAVLLVCLLVACTSGGGPSGEQGLGRPAGSEEGSANARHEIVEALRADLEAERHGADGGGRAWLVDDESTEAVVGRRGRWTFDYEAGPEGIAEGGHLFFQVAPFWGWSTPQAMAEDAPGYTEVTTDAENVLLEPWVADQHLLAIGVSGARLEPGDRVRVVYGAGEAGAYPDRFAEARSSFRFAVDGDGDGVRAFVDESPAVAVRPAEAYRLHVTLPAAARVGETVRLTAAVLDASGSADLPLVGEVVLDLPEGLTGPDRVTLVSRRADDPQAPPRGTGSVELRAEAPGVYRVAARVEATNAQRGPEGAVYATTVSLEAEADPLVVDDALPRVLWGDLQIHSVISDGTGIPDDLYAYARHVAGLDAAAVTDHDHWGTPFLDGSPVLWEEIRQAALRAHEPGRFVSFLGYEWTSWVHGHRHVLYAGDDGPVISSIDPATDTPAELWSALEGRDAITIAHHTAGEPVATNWSYAPDPAFEQVVEIVSVHGSSEARDSPSIVRGALDGHFVRDALDLGYRLGFVGSGDGHDGHPGLAHLGGPTGGLAGILAEELTREAVLEAIRARRTYATSGARIYLGVTLGGEPMGSVVGPESLELAVRVVAPRPVRSIEAVRAGRVENIPGVAAGARDIAFERTVAALAPGEYLYVRVILEGGDLAWSSPFFGKGNSKLTTAQ